MNEANLNNLPLAKVLQRDPDIRSGDLVFAGTRVPVDNFVSYLKGDHTIQEFLQDYPTVERWQIESYLELSTRSLDNTRAQNESATR